MEHLDQKLRNDYGWKGSTSSLRRVLKKIGFKWAKLPDNRKILVETSLTDCESEISLSSNKICFVKMILFI
jgi:hypothetical protein